MPGPKVSTPAPARSGVVRSGVASSAVAIGTAAIFIASTAILGALEGPRPASPAAAESGWTLRGHLDEPMPIANDRYRA